MRVVVNDANILIDLIDVGLLDLFFQKKLFFVASVGYLPRLPR